MSYTLFLMADLIFGKYEIQHRLAIGGMGEVFFSVQKGGFERPVILKSLLPDLALQEGFIDQFLDEARVAATLNHPNVVSIYEVGLWNGTYYIAMEYIRGRNLSQLLRRSIEQQVQVPAHVAGRIIHDAAAGLHHAHVATDGNGNSLNIVHRDISPQNIMVREDGVTTYTRQNTKLSMTLLDRVNPAISLPEVLAVATRFDWFLQLIDDGVAAEGLWEMFFEDALAHDDIEARGRVRAALLLCDDLADLEGDGAPGDDGNDDSDDESIHGGLSQ